MVICTSLVTKDIGSPFIRCCPFMLVLAEGSLTVGTWRLDFSPRFVIGLQILINFIHFSEPQFLNITNGNNNLSLFHSTKLL